VPRRRRQTQFNAAGCNTCHTARLTTGPSIFTDLTTPRFSFSDFALHHMGSKLADGVTQGAAGPDEFRTRRCGERASACSSCMTAAPTTWWT